MAELIRKAVKSETLKGPDGVDVKVILSLGVTCFARPEDPARAFSFVDQLLYKAKHAGRDQCSIRAFDGNT